MDYENERYHLKFNKALGDYLPTKIDDDVWSVMSAHRPGRARLPMHLPNRSLIYKLTDDDGPFLVILNALVMDHRSGQPIKAIKALAEQEGAPIRYILTPASSHNICLTDYAKALPDATVMVPEGRVPMRRALDLMKLPNVKTFPIDDPLPELRELGLHVHVWGGMREGPAMNMMSKFPMSLLFPSHNEPSDLERSDLQECVIFHEASRSITNGGHHIWYRPAGTKPPFALKPMLPKEGFNWGAASGYPIYDKERFLGSINPILSWDTRSGAKDLFSDFVAGLLKDDWTGAPLDPEVYPS
jgi:hypothetical protein